MTRFGWAFLALVVLVIAGFAATTRFGGEIAGPSRKVVAPVIAEPIAAAPSALAVPVAGVAPVALVDSWGDARGDGTRAHHGTDIPAPAGTPVLAAASGVVEKLFQSAQGGTTLYVRSPDRRWSYYYAHLAGYAPGLHEGQGVRRGETIGYVGDTGDAGAGNFHLHFGLERLAPDQHWWQGQAVNPYPLLAGSAPRR